MAHQGVPAQMQAAAQLQQTVQQGAPVQAQNATTAAQQNQQNPQMAAAANSPYPGYSMQNLTGIDMSGFNAIDWSSMYGMNMYV